MTTMIEVTGLNGDRIAIHLEEVRGLRACSSDGGPPPPSEEEWLKEGNELAHRPTECTAILCQSIGVIVAKMPLNMVITLWKVGQEQEEKQILETIRARHEASGESLQ